MKDNTNADTASQLSLTAMLFICSTFASLATAQSTLPDFKESDPVSDYLEAIDTAESELSAYSLELSDLYLGLGKSHLSEQEYVRARQAFQRGMQIDGLILASTACHKPPI